jgi:hypothetical protein
MAGRKSAWPFFLIFLILLGIGGLILFGPHRRPKSLEPLPTTGQLSQSVVIDVYVDTSGSMKHFQTNDGRPNTFRELLQNLEFALKSGASQGGWDPDHRQVRFWKFGPKEGPIRLDKGKPGDEGSLRALAEDPSQFNAPDTPIESAVNAEPEASGTPRLHILITDLYQSDGKLERPAMALVRQFLSGEHGAVAVYGVRNPYQGNVGDIPGQGQTPLPNAATSMPFYVIVSGDNAADVRHTQELLTAGEYGAPLRRANSEGRLFAAFFSKETGEYSRQMVLYDVHVSKSRKGLPRHFSAIPNPAPKPGQERMSQPEREMERKFSAQVPSFEADHREGIASLDLRKRVFKDDLVGVSWIAMPPAPDGPIFQTPDVVPVTGAQWKVRALYCEVPKETGGETCKGNLQVDRKASEKGIQVCGESPDPGHALMCHATGNPALAIVIDRKYLTNGRKYLLEISQVVDAAGQSANLAADSNLMLRWNMNSDEVQALLGQREGQRMFPTNRAIAPDAHPGKTPNLSLLLSALLDRVLSSGRDSGETEITLKTYFLYLNAR